MSSRTPPAFQKALKVLPPTPAPRCNCCPDLQHPGLVSSCWAFGETDSDRKCPSVPRFLLRASFIPLHVQSLPRVLSSSGGRDSSVVPVEGELSCVCVSVSPLPPTTPCGCLCEAAGCGQLTGGVVPTFKAIFVSLQPSAQGPEHRWLQ